MAQENPLTDAGLDGLFDTAIEISEKRRNILQRMRAALEAGDNAEALKLAARLCGVNQGEETGRGINPRINLRASG
jgi:hypothetical protein